MGCFKKIITLFLFLVVILIPTTAIHVKADAGEIRTVYLSATEYDYPPFSVTDSGEADGFSVELLKAVAEEMGIVVTFKIDQWTVLKEELKNGELDILPLVGYTEERDEIYDFTAPYIVMRGNIFVRNGDNDIQSQDDLFGKEILVLDGDNSQEWAWSIGLDSELTATTTLLEAFELLASGEYDAVLAQGLVGEKIISDNGLDNITPIYVYDDNGVARYKLNLEGYEQKFCFAVVEGDSELLSILNEGLSIVSTNGTYDELYQKWFPFLLENEGVSTAEIIRYVTYILVPILVLFVIAYFITTRRTIKIRTKEIKVEKERSEQYLRDLILSGKIFETSIEHAPIPIMIHAEDGEVINISKTWTSLTGYQKEDIPTIYEWTENAYGTKKADVQEFISKLYSLTETLHDGEFEITTKDGRKLIWDFYSTSLGKLTDGRLVAMSVATDVTERIEMIQLLKESEQRFEALHNTSFGGIAIHEKGVILESNQGLADITGYSIDELIGLDGLKLIALEYRDLVMDKIVSGYEKPYEVYGTRKNGDIYPLRLEARNIPFKGRQVRVVEFRDITVQKQAEKALLDSENRFRTLYDRAPMGYQSLDINGCFLEVNQTWLDMLGYQKNEVFGKWFGDFLIPEHQMEFKKGFERFKQTGYVNREFDLLNKHGDIVSIEFKGLIGLDKNGNFEKTFCVLSDVTEINKLEKINSDNLNKIKESENDYRLLTTQMPLGLSVNEMIYDNNGNPIDFRFISVNESWENVMGIKKEYVLGKRVMELFPNTESYWIENYGKVASTGQPLRFENYSVELKRYLDNTVYSPKPGYFASVINDVSERVKSEREREYLLTHDQLTGLTNRLYFDEQIKKLDKLGILPITLINLDINGLKIINEAFGHSIGDSYIQSIAQIIKKVCENKGSISRVSGDQFTVVLEKTTKEDAERLAVEIANLVKSQNVNGIQLSIAYGIAIKIKSEDINKLFMIAENNMQSNKIFESQSYRNQSIKSMINAYHEKNPREEEHTNRVSKMSEEFGKALKMNDDDINKLKAISHLHDIGKIAIDEAILNKPGKLTDLEWEIVKKHPEVGARIIATSGEYSAIAEDILSHHERFDGKGYPRGIAGKEIPIRARMIAIIDSYDAMISDRPYRKALSIKEAIDEIISCSGTQFDPELVDVFVKKVIKLDSIG